MKVRFVVILAFLLCCSANAQVLQSPGSGIPGKVVASFARGKDIAVLFVNNKGTYTAARWENNQWNFYGELTKPNTGAIPVDRYNFTSIAVFNNEIYVGGYLENIVASDNFIDHLQKWDGSKWATLSNVIKSKINGITALDVFEGRLICAGLFSNVIGLANVENIAAFDGSVWQYLGDNNSNQGTNGKINRLTVIGNRLYICGNFSHFAGTLTGNIAYYTSLTSNWGGIGSPFIDEALQIASFNINSQKYITALGVNGGKREVRIFNGSGWNVALDLDTFSKAEINSIAGMENYLLLGGAFVHNFNATSLLRYDLNTGFSFTGSRITDTFYLHQSDEDEAYAWGNFKEQNTGINNFAQIIPGYGHVYGTLYNDANQNCAISPDEKGLGNVFIKLTKIDNGKIYMLLTKPDGTFNLALPEGNYAFTIQNSRHWQNSCEASPKVYIKPGKYSSLNIGQFKLSQINDIKVQLVPAGQLAALPGGKVRLQLLITNLGSTEISGATVYLKHPDKCSGFVSDPIPANYDNSEATYSLINLKPEETQLIFVEMKLPENAKQDEDFSMNAYVGSALNNQDVFKQDNKDTLKLRSDLSFVPNSVHKKSESGIYVNKTSRELIYTITFENTSTELVNRVILTDTIANAEMFSGSSLEAKSNHKFSFTNSNNTQNIIKLVVENAGLTSKEADSRNSFGFIRFKVTYNRDLPENGPIPNTAYADFDNKWQGVSETVLVTAYNPYSNAYTAGNFKGKLYPVPASASGLTVSFASEQKGVINVYSVTGVLVLSKPVNGEKEVKLNTEGLAGGIYLMQTPAGSIKFTVK